MNAPKVVVIGGGIGGLCLAQGLHAEGVPVEVFERDEHPASCWEGYRIHIDPAGARSLRACLPARLWDTFVATSAPGGDFGFLTERLAELLVVEEAISHPGGEHPVESHYAVDRRALRRLLLSGIEDLVHFGAEFRSYTDAGDGRVTAEFTDGRRVTAEVLVGADGPGSRVRKQYLPQAAPRPAGVAGIAHKLFLTEQTLAWMPERLGHGMNLVSGSDGVSLFTSAYRPPAGARDRLAALGGAVPDDLDQPYVLCALVTRADRLPAGLRELDDAGLRDLADELVAGWHPDLRRVLAESDPSCRSAQTFSVAPEIAPWPSSRVTVLGDAIHAVPATGGLGGNTALRDARRLTMALSGVARGDSEPVPAIAAYEADLRDHGYAAIRDALEIRDQMLAHGVVSTAVSRAWFRLCRRSATLRRRSFGDRPDAVSAPRAWEHTLT
ncbi:FAD-dependent oxidoreductase [Amycolatopsis antarctica]|nr:FAD-dependent monooxygenase [Amycolatopsis antarctica]